jgi:hypothetical protein
MRKGIFYASWALIALFLCFSVWVSCEKKPLESKVEELSIQTLKATPSSMQKNNTSTVEAWVVDQNGNPKSGAEVAFSVNPDSLGWFASAVATTGTDGKASAVFHPFYIGTGLIEASLSSGANKNTQITVAQTYSAGISIQIEIDPPSLIADGVSTCDITITVTDSSGNPVPNGTVVKLTAGEKFVDIDGDGYFTEFVDSLVYDGNANGRWDPIGLINSQATTTSGVANVTYTSGVVATSVYIKATVVATSASAQKENIIQLTPNTQIASITMATQGPSIQVKGTGGLESIFITATGWDENGNRVPGGIAVSFVVTDGPDGGENINGEGYGPITANTNSLGEASVTLNSGTVSGTIRLRASAGSVLSQTTKVTVSAGPPAHLSLGANPLNIRGWDYINVTSDIVALVVDVYGNPVPDNTSVYFSTEEGMVDSHSETLNGLAKSAYHSGEPRNNGIAYIYASTSGGTVADTLGLIVSGPPAYVEFLAYPSTLLADGTSEGDVNVRVLDINRNFVVSGTQVKMETDFGSIGSGATADGINNSIWETKLKSAVLNRDYSPVSPDNGIGAISIVKARCGWVENYVTVPFLTGKAYSKNCAIDIPTSIQYGSSVPIEVTIKDRYGNPLGGHTLTASSFGCSISGLTQITDEYGIASGFTFIATSDTTVKSSTVTVYDSDPKGGVVLSTKVSLSSAE